MTNNYYDPLPYVLPDEDALFEGFEEEDTTPEISIERREFPEHQSRCIFFYALSRDSHDYDLVVRSSPWAVSWSMIDEESFSCVGLRELHLLRWMLQVAEVMLTNFDACWSLPAHQWQLPPAPDGWKVVIQ